MGIVDLFMRSKNVKVILALRDHSKKWYISTLAKVADITYPHAVQIIKLLEEKGVVKSIKQGRTRYITLTELGEQISTAIENAYIQLRNLDEDK